MSKDTTSLIARLVAALDAESGDLTDSDRAHLIEDATVWLTEAEEWEGVRSKLPPHTEITVLVPDERINHFWESVGNYIIDEDQPYPWEKGSEDVWSRLSVMPDIREMNDAEFWRIIEADWYDIGGMLLVDTQGFSDDLMFATTSPEDAGIKKPDELPETIPQVLKRWNPEDGFYHA
jgi:hypothetical protein